ncbi:hypothetical protein [Tenacibaculum phage Larrie]|nr:hypothetical protein [Tenacibaculum phage Larrie]
MIGQTSTIRNLRTIKAHRGDTLKIDLGKTYEGTMKAWMKRHPDDKSFRSFDIIDNRYLVMHRNKTRDYYNVLTGNLVETVQGRWFFDVELTPTGGTDADTYTVYTGSILFEYDVTNSNGVEYVLAQNIELSYLDLIDTPTEFAESGSIPVVSERGDTLDWKDKGYYNTPFNLNEGEDYINYNYLGKKVYAVLVNVPEKIDGSYFLQHNLNIDKYLRFESWENGLNYSNPKEKAREDISQIVYVDDNSEIGGSVIGVAPIGSIEASVTLTSNSFEITGGYEFLQNKLIYIEYTKNT